MNIGQKKTVACRFSKRPSCQLSTIERLLKLHATKKIRRKSAAQLSVSMVSLSNRPKSEEASEPRPSGVNEI